MVKEFPYLIPDVIFPPGETLLESLEYKGMTQTELAKRTGMTTKHINEIVKGKIAISPEMALKLESALGVPASMWLALEQQYQEHLARQREYEQFKTQNELLNRYPIKEMTQLGWLEATADEYASLKQLHVFLGTASLELWDAMCSKQVYSAAFRQSPSFRADQNALALWLRKGEIDAYNIECQPYSEANFRAALAEVRNLTAHLPEDFVPCVQNICARAGVAVVFVPELKGCRVSGAARWQGSSKAIIQLSARYKTDDHLWFSFFHEAGHILLHPKKILHVESEHNAKTKYEREADKFASDYLIPPTAYSEFVRETGPHFSADRVTSFAAKIGIAPGIVVGRLQHDCYIPYANLNGLKEKVART